MYLNAAGINFVYVPECMLVSGKSLDIKLTNTGIRYLTLRQIVIILSVFQCDSIYLYSYQMGHVLAQDQTE